MVSLKKLKTPLHLEAFRQEILSGRDSGKQEVKVCFTTGCRAGGALKIIDALKEEVTHRGLADQVNIRTTGCRGFCEKGR
jgi:NADH-quinone oxidoreductase subunit F